MQYQLFRLALCAYVAAMFFAFAYLRSKHEKYNLWMWRILCLGVAAHATSFIGRMCLFWAIEENRYFFPVHTPFGIFSWLALVMASIFCVLEWRHRLNILGAFVLPWAAIN